MPDRKPREGFELLCELVFRPAAHLVARALAPLRVPPPAVVLAGTATGIAAAVEIGRHSFIAAALLLQLKTVLDNADGQLARLTGRITAFGRYLDSESDLLVDAAVFAALGLWLGPWIALAGFVVLTSVLSLNFNLERLRRGAPAGEPDGSLVARIYGLVYAPQDRLAELIVRRVPSTRTVGVAANLGLSTQLAALGLCLALGHPGAYLVVLFLCTAMLITLAATDRGDSVNTEPAVVLPWHGRETSARRIADAEWEKLERHAGEILSAFGMDLNTPGTRDTPARFLRALYDATAGYDGDPKLLTAFPSEHAGERGGLIVEGPISFHALCEHHALPFHGTAHMAYVAGDEIIGISKLTRIVRLYARRFTVQERMGEQIADTLVELIAPRGVAVCIDAAHLCTQMRGVEEDGSRTTTTFWRGLFDEDADLRREFLMHIRP